MFQARTSVSRLRGLFLGDVNCKLNGNFRYAAKVGGSLNLLRCALGDLPIEKDLLKSYENSFLHAEHLTYTEVIRTAENEVSGFKLKLYDQEKGMLLLETYDNFYSFAKTKGKEFMKIPAVCGYRKFQVVNRYR